MKNNDIIIVGARTNTLKNIHVTIPEGAFTVITGVSGSGKSSLAFQTLYAEGQNRFVECLNTYSRQFIHTLAKPKVEQILHVRPALAIKQENRMRSGRSTVGTSSELHDYLRLLFARIGVVHCTQCGARVRTHSKNDIFHEIESYEEGEKLAFLFPLGAYSLEALKELGFSRILSQGTEKIFEKETLLDDPEAYVIYERMSKKRENTGRIREAISSSLHFGKGIMGVFSYTTGKVSVFSDQFRCDTCSLSYTPLSPAFFSFNSPLGACATCEGYGDEMVWDEEKVIVDPTKSLLEGAIDLFSKPSMKWERAHYTKVWASRGIPMTLPYHELSEEVKVLIWKDIEEVFTYLERKKYKMHVRVFLSKYRGYRSCRSCQGTRLRREVESVHVGKKSITEVTKLSLEELYQYIQDLELTDYEAEVSHQLREDLLLRVEALLDVGLPYLTLDRRMNTLSGGESQRLKLASCLRSGLSGVLYVLDEPTIGLHPQNTEALIAVLLKLRDLGNTVVVVEHEEMMMEAADYLIDMGPGAGEKGGTIIFQGVGKEIVHEKGSLTGEYLSGKKKIEREKIQDTSLELVEMHEIHRHNLKNISIKFPKKRLSVIAGVSGSGKSSLMEVCHEVFGGKGESMDNPKSTFREVILIDQEPIGKSSRSVPVTYLGFFDPIRKLFASTPEAKKLKLTPGHFSFNSSLGQCPHCDGHGERVEEMYFLNDLVIVCEHCEGKRYKKKVLKATYGFRTIADVLEMTVTEALHFFEGHKKIVRALSTLVSVGLGYVRLGQSALTFSGGEAQRFKIAAALLTQKSQEGTLYLMDEPTTGLHFADIQTLLHVCSALVKEGATILMVEHNMDMVKNADWIIELGPVGGEKGGYVLYEGTFTHLPQEEKSMLKSYL